MALGTAVAQYPGVLADLDRRADSNSSLDFLDREIAGGNSLDVNQDAVIDARSLIPPHDSYRVVVGPHLKEKNELTLPYIDSFFRYILMPRRPSGGAAWIVCYGCDPKRLGSTFEVLRDEGDGVLIGRVRR